MLSILLPSLAPTSIALSCPVDGLSAPERAAIAKHFTDRIEAGEFEKADRKERMAPLLEAIRTCQRAAAWSGAKAKAAGMWWTAEIARPAIEDRIKARGLSPDGIKRAYRSLNDEQRAVLLSDDEAASDAAIDALMNRSDQEGPLLLGIDQEAVLVFGIFVGLLQTMEQAERAFSAE